MLVIVCIPFSNEISTFLADLAKNDTGMLLEISFNIFSLEITLLSIIIAIKQKNVYDIKVYKLVLKYRVGSYNISNLFAFTMFYFTFSVINKVLGTSNVILSCLIIIFSLLLIINLIVVINMSTANLFYKINKKGNTNILSRRKGNFPSIIKDEHRMKENNSQIVKNGLTNKYLLSEDHFTIVLSLKRIFVLTYIKDYDKILLIIKGSIASDRLY